VSTGPDGARALALRALVRIDTEGAYANLVLPALLSRSDLSARDRAFATSLVYGTTRMRRACDWLVDRFLAKPPPPAARAALRLGAYQLVFLGTPAHAAVSATVGVAPKGMRPLVNAVLRKVAAAPVAWPDDATRLSYPDWIVERLVEDLGRDDALGALTMMNEPAAAVERPDGYVQDLASQEVTALVEAQPGERVADLCAAPGGKATGMAAAGAVVVAADVRPARAGLVQANAARLGLADAVRVVVADARRPPLRAAAFDRVLVDAPCSGLGALRRRPDARWRIDAGDVERLAALQHDLLDAALGLVRPGGLLVYSACTLTRAEGVDVDRAFRALHPGLEPLPCPPAPWSPWEGAIARLLPQAAGTDGMVVARYRVPGR